MPIVLHIHYHLLALDIQNEKCMQYSSLMSEIYDSDAIAMVCDSEIILNLDFSFIKSLISYI